jgi:hypothetical protein
VYGLPFGEVWVLDFEFISESGARPSPVCLVARELTSNRLLRLWRDKFDTRPPFRVDEHALFVAYFASAEWGCFAVLGWPPPARVLDLYAEFRARTNGTVLPAGRSLLGALSYYGIPSITSQEKRANRDLVLRGGPWSAGERAEISDYCQTDVDATAALFDRMLPSVRATRQGLGQALLRGRYTQAVARMEHVGVPLDVPRLHRLRTHWPWLKAELVQRVDRDFGVYEGPTFKEELFADWLTQHGIPWRYTSTGRPQLDQDTFRDMAKTYPQLQSLHELRHALAELRLEDLAVGPDARNRCLLSPFGARSGRNTPSNTRFIFGPAVWLRGLIKPPMGRALAYIDWSSQEVVIAAALSGDPALGDAVRSGDPYLRFAQLAGLAPADASKDTHREIRDLCKTCLLGTNYGMQAQSLAYRTGLSVIQAQHLLRRLAAVFPIYTEWSQHMVDVGYLTGELRTAFGWPIHIDGDTRPTSLRNYLMQATGAEMLRLACCLATERGVDVCAPVHDALLIESATDDVAAVVETTRAAMADAAAAVLDGWEIRTDVNVVRYPRRYADPRGQLMWQRVTELLDMREVRDVR